MRPTRGFTLIELLFVVAIIAILAGISVPNFLEAQTRSKLARMQCDMSAMRAAIRAYSAQEDAYPPNSPDHRRQLRELRRLAPQNQEGAGTDDDSVMGPELMPSPPDNAAKKDPCAFIEETGQDLVRLTTPVAWLASMLPVDCFGGKYRRLGYSGHYEPTYVAYLDLHGATLDKNNKETSATKTLMNGAGFLLVSAGPDSTLNLRNPYDFSPSGRILYDPTNGTSSAGDLIMQGW